MTEEIFPTPFKLTTEEILLSSAATILFQQLQIVGRPITTISQLSEPPQYGFTDTARTEAVGPRFVRITDIKGGKINWDAVPYCSCQEPEKYLLRDGDILVARAGSVGKSFLVTDIPEVAVFASYMIRLRAKGHTLPDLIYWFFQSQQFWLQVADVSRGSAMGNINGKMLAALTLPQASAEEQRAISEFLVAFRKKVSGEHIELPELSTPFENVTRIVARIEELARRVEEARGLRQETVEEAEALIASAGKEAFNPKADWAEAKVGEFCDPPQYGYTASAVEEPVGPKMLRITDIQEGRVNWGTVPYCECPEPEKYLLRENDLVFARTGATTGKSFVIRDCPESVFASYLIRLRVRRLVTVDYLYRYFQSPSYWSQITDEKKGTGQPNVNGQKLSNLRIPIAPPNEQRRIVAYLDGLQAKVDGLRRLQAETQKELDALMPSVLAKAFAGEL